MNETGPDRRDRKLEQVEGNADKTWMDKAYACLIGLASSGQEFSSNDLWATGLPRPREPRALGVLMLRASRLALIYPVRWEPSEQPNQNGRPVRVWRGRQVQERHRYYQ